MQGFGPKCGSPKGLARGISQNDIKEILQVHNQWRAKVANGLVTRGIPGPQPPAADMEQMVMNIIYYASNSEWKIPMPLFTMNQKKSLTQQDYRYYFYRNTYSSS